MGLIKLGKIPPAPPAPKKAMYELKPREMERLVEDVKKELRTDIVGGARAYVRSSLLGGPLGTIKENSRPNRARHALRMARKNAIRPDFSKAMYNLKLTDKPANPQPANYDDKEEFTMGAEYDESPPSPEEEKVQQPKGR